MTGREMDNPPLFEHYRREGIDVVRVGVSQISDDKALSVLGERCGSIEEEAYRRKVPPLFVFNCEGVTQIVTRALAQLLRFSARIVQHGGRVAICGLAGESLRAYQTVGMSEHVKHYASEDEAVAALSKDSPTEAR